MWSFYHLPRFFFLKMKQFLKKTQILITIICVLIQPSRLLRYFSTDLSVCIFTYCRKHVFTPAVISNRVQSIDTHEKNKRILIFVDSLSSLKTVGNQSFSNDGGVWHTQCDSCCCQPVRARAVGDGKTAPGDTVKFNPPSVVRARVCVRVCV